jgi:hypothetical protein
MDSPRALMGPPPQRVNYAPHLPCPCCCSGHAEHILPQKLAVVRLPSCVRKDDPWAHGERPECWIPPPPELKDGILRHTPCFHGIDHVPLDVFSLCQVT